MTAYLLTWNPKRWDWFDLPEDIQKVRGEEGLIARWSCGVTKSIQRGDRAFLIKLGPLPRGIIASGTVTREVFEGEHWDEERARAGILAKYVEVKIDTLLNPYEENILHVEILDAQFPEMEWHPQSSGTRIPDHIVGQLERLWLARQSNTDQLMAEEVAVTEIYYEGALARVSVNAYERNPDARRSCISRYGPRCSVCGFDFEEMYGEIGRGFIHVHHLFPISQIGEQYAVDPVRDLRPVCPNCHAMLHRREPPYSIGELQAIMDSR